MLFDSHRHETLHATPWDEAHARSAIERIVDDTVSRFSTEALWPVHPLDFPDANDPLRMLYFGAAGVIWGLDHLHREGAAVQPPDFTRAMAGLLEANRAAIRPFNMGTDSLLMGDTGILLLDWKLSRATEVATDLARAISASQEHPALELMFGEPGTMLASLAMHDWTGEELWADLFRQAAGRLWDNLELDSERCCQLWTQEIMGAKSRQIGAVHGFAANAVPIIRGRHLLTESEWSQWLSCIVETITATALREDGLTNWPQSVGEHRPGRTDLLVQHCHGAPGVVNCLAGLPEAGLGELLEEAGELTWAAGPVSKGATLCHGTAGNGYAFLKLFRRTGDSLWLDRARAFAMHAIKQSEQHFTEFGHRRYSLWTGDLGLAIYLWSCIDANDQFPTMDVF